MKSIRIAGLVALVALATAAIGQQLINVGSAPNDHTGDPARTAFQKINANTVTAFSWSLTCNAPLAGCGAISSSPTISLSTVPVSSGGTGATTLTGPLKGNGTAAISSAVATDVIGLWSGTCNSGSYLRADGTCQAPSGSGTVTSVGLSIPGIFTITNSPVVGTGTLTATPAGTSGGIPYFSSATSLASSGALSANQIVLGGGAGASPTSLAAGTTTTVLHGNASGSPSFGAVTLTTDVTGILPAANGGTGVNNGASTLTLGQSSAFTSSTGNIGTLELLQNSQAGSYTLVASDAGKQIYHSSGSAHTFTIPANGTIAYPIGTTFTFINQSGGGALTIAITTDTLYWSSSGTTGSRTLAAYGVATAIKIDATHWIISGTGLT